MGTDRPRRWGADRRPGVSRLSGQLTRTGDAGASGCRPIPSKAMQRTRGADGVPAGRAAGGHLRPAHRALPKISRDRRRVGPDSAAGRSHPAVERRWNQEPLAWSGSRAARTPQVRAEQRVGTGIALPVPTLMVRPAPLASVEEPPRRHRP